ncbi:MAG: hypothetical protein LAP21_08290 [Acidobacteriia bacterium]|nr:hypothetical protein [Terriglobia bacterium]
MHRRKLLKGLLALPVTGAFTGCQAADKREESQRVSRPATGNLQIVLNGAFAIVIQRNSRNRIRVFSPADPRHCFYFNNLEKTQQEMVQKKSYNFELLSDGLALRHAEVHVKEELKDFHVRTDRWCQEDYFITIDLPAPEEISFLPPLKTVRFKATGKEARMAGTHVLKYSVADMNQVRIAPMDGKDDIRPLSCSELVEQYKRTCSTMKDEKTHGSCAEMVKRYPEICPEGSRAFFFGVGLPSGDPDNGHAIQFFNERILDSFPRLKAQLQLAAIVDREPYKTGSLQGEMVPAVFNADEPRPRLLEVAAIVDCKFGGPIVDFP